MSRKLWRIPRPADFEIKHAGKTYLKRWFVIPRNRWFNIYLHRFEASDDDRALHDHPWWSLSIPLRGGYREIVQRGGQEILIDRKPWRPILRPAARAHRVILKETARGPLRAWTLFITGPKVRDWGFWCPQGFVPWRDFVDPARADRIGPGCGE